MLRKKFFREAVIGSNGGVAEPLSRGFFALSPFFAITYVDIWALIFFKDCY